MTGESGFGTSLRQYAGAMALVAISAAGCLLFRDRLKVIDVAMLFLLAVVVAGTRYRRGPALLASALSIAAFDFGFVPPYNTLHVSDTGYLLTFAMMLIVAAVMSGLTARVREQSDAALKLAERDRAARVEIEAEQLRTSLLSSLSHDLRTPLGSIEGAASVLVADAGSLSREERRELAETVVTEAHRMAQLVNNLLDMMRLDTGSLAVHRTWQPLEECLGVSLIRLDPVLAGIRVESGIGPELPLVSVDEVLLEQVFVNLLENAARYVPADGHVRISARADGGELTVEVADNGPGITPGEEEAIFRKFHRSRSTETRSGAGSGLGLAICRGIVTAHGGRIWVERGIEGGAAFRFTLPAATTGGPTVPQEAERG